MTDEILTTPQIFTFRGQPVIRDADLAALFSYTTGNLNKLVNNNAERFGGDFAFRLNEDEFADLKFQLGISKAAPSADDVYRTRCGDGSNAYAITTRG